MQKVHSVKDIKAILCDKKIDDILILLDIDDTIIVPTSPMYNTYPHVIDNIKSLLKKAKEDGDDETAGKYIDLIARWRLHREVILTDDEWPAFINNMKGVTSVNALTKMDTGKFGRIDSMEKWRYNELLSLDILFEEVNEDPITLIDNATFYGGIYFAGKCSKGEILRKIPIKVKTVCFVDDNLKYIQSVADACKEMNIEFIGLHFMPPKFEVNFNPSNTSAIEAELMDYVQ